MEIKVYDINETIIEEELNEIEKDNINKIFEKIFSQSNISHLKVNCYATENSILKKYYDHNKGFDLRKFAERLKEAELKQDGTRNKQIKVGSLFIKKTKDYLYLLKLENIEVIDKENNYEMRHSFSTETEYYKGCIFTNDIENITIIDKNKAVAKYWRKEFLNLDLIKDEYTNSIQLIQLLQSDKLFSEEIQKQDNYPEIKETTEDYLFRVDIFDKNVLADKLRSESKIDEIKLIDIYSDDAKVIDADFKMSKGAIKEVYKKTIEVTSDTKIYTDNFLKLIRRQGIEYKDGEIILKIEEEFIEKLPGELKDEN